MYSSVSLENQIWFLRVCHHVPFLLYPFYRRLGGPQGRSGRTENLVPTGIRHRTVQPVVSRYTDWATQPTTVNSNSRNSNWQCSLFVKKNPIIRIFYISGWFAVPINLDKWSSTATKTAFSLWVPLFQMTLSWWNFLFDSNFTQKQILLRPLGTKTKKRQLFCY